MTFRALAAAMLLIAVPGFPGGAHAEQRKVPTLDEILERLEGNLNHYDRSLPSLFCDEHVESRVEPGRRNEDTVTDSTFRLKRIVNADHTTTLVDSREIRKVDGKPATSQHMKGPSMLSGAFEGGLAVVSLDQRECMKYTLERSKDQRPGEPYVIRFATLRDPANPADCLLQEKSKGQVFIDPASMEITHLELTTPRHVIIPGTWYASSVIGKRELTVDYAPVVLDGETFWMPSRIASRDASGWTTWSFEASYRDYHRLEVKSRILPGPAVAR